MAFSFKTIQTQNRDLQLVQDSIVNALGQVANAQRQIVLGIDPITHSIGMTNTTFANLTNPSAVSFVASASALYKISVTASVRAATAAGQQIQTRIYPTQDPTSSAVKFCSNRFVVNCPASGYIVPVFTYAYYILRSGSRYEFNLQTAVNTGTYDVISLDEVIIAEQYQ